MHQSRDTALALLGDATVAAVAREVGYESAFAFNAAFKRAHGRSPAGWRRAGSDGEN